MSIGKRVRQVREYHGLTHYDFSSKLQEKENRIKSVEYEKQRAPGELLAKIVTEFQVNALWLLTGGEQMHVNSAETLREEPPDYSSSSNSETVILTANQRQACLATFIQYWINEKQDEDHIWLEGQLRRFVPEYADFIASK